MAGGSEKFRLNMCEGPLLGKLIRFAVPLFFTMLLQLMFNAADLIVVGRYSTPEALAAVGATGALIFLLVNVFFGLTIGTNVVAANAFGAKDEKLLALTTHTSMTIGIFGGIFLAVVGYFAARPLLEWTSAPPDVLDKATLYMQIFFLGMPMTLIYDFGSAVLRAVGDTRRPLIYLAVSGCINVPLNMILVIKCGMDVDGVAWATVVSQTIACLMVWHALATATDGCRLHWRQLRITWHVLVRMLKIGVPAAVQAAAFAISNVLIQSSVNSFGSMAVAGNSVAANIEGVIYLGPFSLHQTCISFVGQNVGARQAERIKKGILYCAGLGVVIATIMGPGMYLFGRQLISIYNSTPEVVHWGMIRMYWVFLWYTPGGLMDVVSGAMRGLGYSLLSACVVVGGICVFRMIWIYTVFQAHHSMGVLLVSYPISWALVAVVNGILLIFVCRKVFRSWRMEEAEAMLQQQSQASEC